MNPPFTPEQLKLLLSQSSISTAHPWATNDEFQIDAFYRGLWKEIMRITGASSKMEWDHYGSGYASFIDAWFYEPTSDFALQTPVTRGEGYYGLVILFCRLSPLCVFMEGIRNWHAEGSSSYMPKFELVDVLTSPGVVALAKQVEPLLESRGLRRLRRDDLASPLPEGTRLSTNLGEPPYKEFDALFYWED